MRTSMRVQKPSKAPSTSSSRRKRPKALLRFQQAIERILAHLRTRDRGTTEQKWDPGMSDADWNQLSGAPVEKVKPDPEYMVIYLPTEENNIAYEKAYRRMQKCIFEYGRKNHPGSCNSLRDYAGDVVLEFNSLATMFGTYGFVTKDLDYLSKERFESAFKNVAEIRHRFAHPECARSLKYVCERVSYGKTMASLLEDKPTVNFFEKLLEGLRKKGQRALQYIRTVKTCSGLKNPNKGWPRHFEYLFEHLVFLHSNYMRAIAEPETVIPNPQTAISRSEEIGPILAQPDSHLANDDQNLETEIENGEQDQESNGGNSDEIPTLKERARLAKKIGKDFLLWFVKQHWTGKSIILLQG